MAAADVLLSYSVKIQHPFHPINSLSKMMFIFFTVWLVANKEIQSIPLIVVLNVSATLMHVVQSLR